MGSLESKLFLAKESILMLTINLWTGNGLCNGSISDIIYKPGEKLLSLPVAIMIQFGNTYTGPSFCSDKARCVPIIPETN